MVLQIFVYVLLIALGEYHLERKLHQFQRLCPSQPSPDETVRAEEQRVQHIMNQDPIKVQKLNKIYENGYHAVKGITFGVEKSQIFGLLGPVIDKKKKLSA